MPGSLARCAGESLEFSLCLGLGGGLVACSLPCWLLGSSRKRRWSHAFLAEGNPEVLGASATVLEKLRQSEGPFRYHVRLQFQASGAVVVSGHARVLDEFWETVEEGGLVEVAYNIKEPREFVIVENQRLQLQLSHSLHLCVLGLCAVVGAVLAMAGTVQTGCPLAVLSFLAMLLPGVAWGRFVWLPLARCIARNDVRASAGGEPC